MARIARCGFGVVRVPRIVTALGKSPLAPLCQRGVILPLAKGGWEGFYKMILNS
jgi:hypothetical protein